MKHVDTRVVTKEVLEGESKGTPGHIEDVAALLDPSGDICILTPDVKVGTFSIDIPAKAALRHDNETGHLNKASDSTVYTKKTNGQFSPFFHVTAVIQRRN